MTTINPHTTRAAGTILTALIYNADHNNHITNATNLNNDKIEGATPPVVDSDIVVFDGVGGDAIKTSGVNTSDLVTQDGSGNVSITGTFNAEDGIFDNTKRLGINLQTSQATTSGTSFDFTSIPANVRRITVMFNGVSLSGTDHFLVQLGDSGGVETTGYAATSGVITGSNTCAVNTSTAGFIVTGANATRLWSGSMTICRVSGNIWVASGVFSADTGAACQIGGNKTLSAELDRVRITRSGTDTFDAGSVTVSWEF